MIDEMHIPQAEKLEQTVLGALLMEPGYLPEVVTELTPDSFYESVQCESVRGDPHHVRQRGADRPVHRFAAV